MHQAISEPTVRVHRPCLLLELPSELQLRILVFLSVKDAVRCAQTCRSLQDTISVSMELQYQMNSAAHCLRLLRVDDEPMHQRHQLLQTKIRGLNTLEFTKMNSTTLDTYDTRHDKPPRIFFVDGWLGATYRSHGDCVARLIDCNTETPSQSLRAWTREMLNPAQPFLSLEHTILDVWQDLMVCASIRTGSMTYDQPICHLQLRTISGANGDSHPLAAHGTLVSAGYPRSCGTFRVEPAQSKFEVNGDFVVMLKSDHDCRPTFSLLQVWNWKEGKTTFILEEHDKEPFMDDFCFLDSVRLLVLTAPGCIEVYSYADFDQPLCLQARFMFPVRMPRSTYLYASPFPDSVYTRGGSSRGPTCVPSLGGRISVLATTNPGRLLVIWNDIFLPHVPPFPDAQQEDGVYIVPWNAWGPANTRALTVCGPQQLLFSISGSRLLLGRPSEEHSGSVIWENYDLFMMDFNPARLSTPLTYKSRDGDSEGEGEDNVTSLPNTIRISCASKAARRWFPGTTLPYRETMLRPLSGGPLAGVHMDENGIALFRCKLGDPEPWQMQLVAEVFQTQ